MEAYRERDAMGREIWTEREIVLCSFRDCGKEAVRILTTGDAAGSWYGFCPRHAAQQWGCLIGATGHDSKLEQIYEEEMEEARR